MTIRQFTSVLYLMVSISFCASRVYAQACTAGDTWTNKCSDGNTCARGTICEIKISHAGSAAIAKLGTNQADIVCLYPGQDVKWEEAETNAVFTVMFPATPTPFQNTNQFVGTTNAADEDTVSTTAGGCYKYSILQRVGNARYLADPKVIVNGVRHHPSHKVKPKQE